MQRFSWVEVAGEKDCLTCAILGEHSILERKLTLIQGNDAAVKFTCGLCGFVSVGIVSVDGTEPVNGAGRASGRPDPGFRTIKHEAVALVPDPLDSAPDPTYVPPKTDAEAISRAYGEVVSPDELMAIIENGYPSEVTAGEWKADRKITPTRMQLGEEGILDVLVEFVRGGEVIYSRKHSSTEGMPNLEADKKALRESCLAAVRPPTMPVASAPGRTRGPSGPVAIESQGWGSHAAVINQGPADDQGKIRQGILRAFQGRG